MSGVYKSSSVKTPNRGRQGERLGRNVLSGLYVGTVTKVEDVIYSGRVRVRIPQFGSDPDDEGHICLLATPFGGLTDPLEALKDNFELAGTTSYKTDPENPTNFSPKSYGMWPQPPAVGSRVVVAFTPSMEQGIVMGTLIQKDRNHMMGGRASAEAYDGQGGQSFGPTVEKNPYDDQTTQEKPLDIDAVQVLTEQGLTKDFSRGHTSSSARRESPSTVFGITTLQGHVLTMDDGDTEGENKQIRLRTRGGAQILMDDTNGFVFISNQKGNAWIEMSADGKIDMYSSNSVSVHAEEDFNVHAKGNINLEAEQGINFRSTGSEGIKIQATAGNIDTHSAINMNQYTGVTLNVKAGGNIVADAGNSTGRVDINGPPAEQAETVEVNNLVINKNVTQSASSRVPEHHPWKGVAKAQSFRTSEGKTN